MSLSSQKGKGFEQLIAKTVRSKLNAKVMRDRRSGAGTNKSDISDWFNTTGLHIEAKDQKVIKIKEWFAQATHGASPNQAPTLVFHADSEILATLRFDDLLNLLVEIADQKAEIDDLRSPVNRPPEQLRKRLLEDQKTCRNGHLSDSYGYCQILGCQFSRGYRKPKAKRS